MNIIQKKKKIPSDTLDLDAALSRGSNAQDHLFLHCSYTRYLYFIVVSFWILPV